MILSQPDLFGGTHGTVEGVRAHCRDFLARNGKQITPDHRTVEAYVSENRWVADCPSCGAGIACWPVNPKACCLLCGHEFTVEFPAEREQAEKVLEERPPANRHWQPWRESVAKLERENELMRDVEQRPTLTLVEPVRAVFTVECSGSGSLDEDVFHLAKTRYTIRYDDPQGLAEVELFGHSDDEVARIKKQLDG